MGYTLTFNSKELRLATQLLDSFLDNNMIF